MNPYGLLSEDFNASLKNVTITDRDKAKLRKISHILMIVFGINLLFIVPNISGIISSPILYKFMFFLSILLAMISLALDSFLTYVFRLVRITTAKRERIPLKIKSFNATLEFFDERAKELGYQKRDKFEVSYKSETYAYALDKEKSGTTLLFLNRIDEMDTKSVQLFGEAINKYISENFNGVINKPVSVISVMCVDRITPPFYKFVDNKEVNRLVYYQFPAGISLGGKKIYVGTSKELFLLSRFMKVRDEILNFLNVNPELNEVNN